LSFLQEEDFEDHVLKMNQEGAWGGNYEIQALSCVLKRHTLVFKPVYRGDREIMWYKLKPIRRNFLSSRGGILSAFFIFQENFIIKPWYSNLIRTE